MPEADALERLDTARGVLLEWYKQYMRASPFDSCRFARCCMLENGIVIGAVFGEIIAFRETCIAEVYA